MFYYGTQTTRSESDGFICFIRFGVVRAIQRWFHIKNSDQKWSKTTVALIIPIERVFNVITVQRLRRATSASSCLKRSGALD